MSKTSFLDMQYNISKRKFLRKPSRMFSGIDRQPSGLPMFQLNMSETRRVFDKFDRDKDGKISRGEYKAILRALRQEGTERDIQKIFEVADLDGDGFIDFKEFMEVQRKGGGVKAVDVQSAFRMFDLDGDGKITVEEVYELLKRLGERCSMQDCQKMVRVVDSNKDGVIDMDEFMTMMTQNMKT
ncbi:hypothetical protein SSX86_021062 [Deinandra increscens subsp. villosa]|uniref:EF-hand domain-containing protein n=1 Tax=Deinandra increscens subsp. villosa TaxID=3103831 RepID=A0AAP0GRD0_9ASTR